MDIRQLKEFVAVAETGSFSKATGRCCLSQSAISQQIKALEEELGKTLFIRGAHSVRLSENGEELLPLAKSAIKSFDEVGEHMKSLDGELCGNLNIGMSHFIEPYVRQASSMMIKYYPNVRVNLYYLPTQDLHRMLMNHELDVAFSINNSKEGEGIVSEPVLTFQLRAVMKDTHPLAKKSKVKYDDLKKHGMIMPEVRERVFETIRQYANFDIDKLNVRAVVNDPQAALNLVYDNNLVTILPDRAVQNKPCLVSREIEGLEIPLTSYSHRLKDICHRKSAEVFLNYMREFCEFYYRLTAN